MLITEDYVRKEFNAGNIITKGTIILKDNEMVTPSAKTFLNEKNITIVKSGEAPKNTDNTETQYTTMFGAVLTEKPEHMTHLRGNLLVFKNHPVIKFRGAIDYLESQIIEVQVFAEKKGMKLLVDDLEEVIKFVKNLIRYEITGERADEFNLLGLNSAELRDHSHHPSKYYGRSHFVPSYKQGETVSKLNLLRTITRKTELVAFEAFVDEYGKCERNDLIKALNRLSSLFWVMMFKYLSRQYD